MSGVFFTPTLYVSICLTPEQPTSNNIINVIIIYNNKFEIYGWKKNAGYGTKKHIDAINKNGVTNLHRKSFEPIKSLLKNNIIKY